MLKSREQALEQLARWQPDWQHGSGRSTACREGQHTFTSSQEVQGIASCRRHKASPVRMGEEGAKLRAGRGSSQLKMCVHQQDGSCVQFHPTAWHAGTQSLFNASLAGMSAACRAITRLPTSLLGKQLPAVHALLS